MYLKLEVNNSQIPIQYPMNGTQDTCTSPREKPTGLSPSLVTLSRVFNSPKED